MQAASVSLLRPRDASLLFNKLPKLVPSWAAGEISPAEHTA